jgi:hypothetical protein
MHDISTPALKRIFLGLLLSLLSGVVHAETTRFHAQLNQSGVPYRIPLEGKAILVNIPAFELIAFENGVPRVCRPTYPPCAFARHGDQPRP